MHLHTDIVVPNGTTHFAEFYGDFTFYKVSEGLHYNTVIDHPEECWQKYEIFHSWDNDEWICEGKGFSDRRLKSITEFIQ